MDIKAPCEVQVKIPFGCRELSIGRETAFPIAFTSKLDESSRKDGRTLIPQINTALPLLFQDK